MKIETYALLAQLVGARLTASGEWAKKHEARILDIVHNTAPSGSGWDCGTKIDLDASTPDKLVFYGSFHHMNEHGYYDGWTDHTVTVRPSLAFGIEMRISGRNRNEVKDYLYEMFDLWLNEEIER